MRAYVCFPVLVVALITTAVQIAVADEVADPTHLLRLQVYRLTQEERGELSIPEPIDRACESGAELLAKLKSKKVVARLDVAAPTDMSKNVELSRSHTIPFSATRTDNGQTTTVTQYRQLRDRLWAMLREFGSGASKRLSVDLKLTLEDGALQDSAPPLVTTFQLDQRIPIETGCVSATAYRSRGVTTDTVYLVFVEVSRDTADGSLQEPMTAHAYGSVLGLVLERLQPQVPRPQLRRVHAQRDRFLLEGGIEGSDQAVVANLVRRLSGEAKDVAVTFSRSTTTSRKAGPEIGFDVRITVPAALRSMPAPVPEKELGPVDAVLDDLHRIAKAGEGAVLRLARKPTSQQEFACIRRYDLRLRVPSWDQAVLILKEIEKRKGYVMSNFEIKAWPKEGLLMSLSLGILVAREQAQ
ncbi:hypothetical protein ACFL59_08350 [Planctomycetota bacterium]